MWSMTMKSTEKKTAAKHVHSIQGFHTSCLYLCVCLWPCECGRRQTLLTCRPSTPCCPHSPADECRDDDAPGCAAAVGIGLLLAFAPPAAQEDGVEEQEEKVQGQTSQRHAAQ